jgi:prolyl oligopeptidase
VDDYHGTRVADPYRWLEDADLPETVRWVEEENEILRTFVDGPTRDALRRRLAELYDYPRISVPELRGGSCFYFRNTGLQDQSVLYVRRDGAERVLLDPNALSSDGTVALTLAVPTRDGRLLAYAISRSGSDRQEILVRDVATTRDLPDRVLWAKFTGISWTPGNEGFYYTRFPEPGSVPPGDENYFGKVYFHRLGRPQGEDDLVYERPEDKELFPGAAVTRDGRYLVLSTARGASGKAEIHVRDREAPGSPLVPLFTGFLHDVSFVDEVAGRLFFRTDENATRGRVVAVDPARGRDAVEVLPEGKDKLEAVAIVHRTLVVHRLRDASSRLELHDLDGRFLREVPLPGLGTVSGLNGEPEDREMFLGFTSFTQPATPYRWDFTGATLTPFEESPVRQDESDYEARQHFFVSRDGTRVPLFLVHRRGLSRDGARPALLYGYGGFNISLTPSYNPATRLWLDRGGVLAVANLRGGGEYGEEWHEAGMRERKQNVFDDFVAAAEWLVAEGWTRPDRLAAQGGSNGGLLVGAVMTQRPDLMGAVLCQVPVADMLRYHRFTVGRFWIPEYGCADDPADFAFLHRYSPLHNVKDGVDYPATLVLTADTDDRVDPGMAKKFAARLQAATDGRRPILIRVERKAGHGLGKPITKLIDEMADMYTFLVKALGADEPSRS